jgi:hypothetical protein
MATARATPVGQRLTYASGPYAAAKGADALVVVTDWDEYRKLDLKRIAWLLGRPAVFDLRGIYQPQAVAEAGLDYHCVGGSPRLGAAHRAAANGHANGSENGSADLAGEGAPAPVQAARQ